MEAQMVERRSGHDRRRKIVSEITVVRLLAFAVFLGIIFAVGSLIIASDVSNNEKTALKAIRTAEYKQCGRLQNQRDADNAVAFRQKRISIAMGRTLLNPGIVATLTGRDKFARIADAKLILGQAQQIKYEPPTNCTEAVNNPNYQRPARTAFPPNYQP